MQNPQYEIPKPQMHTCNSQIHIHTNPQNPQSMEHTSKFLLYTHLRNNVQLLEVESTWTLPSNPFFSFLLFHLLLFFPFFSVFPFFSLLCVCVCTGMWVGTGEWVLFIFISQFRWQWALGCVFGNQSLQFFFLFSTPFHKLITMVILISSPPN